MKRVSIIFILLTIFTLMSYAKVASLETASPKEDADSTKVWKTGGVMSLNFSQVSMTNWAAGGENSLAFGSFGSFFANYKKGKTSFENTLDLAYGIQKQGDDKLIKTDDKIDLASKYGREIKKGLYYSALINFKTQMASGYKYPNDSVEISNFLAPLYILGSLGLDYKPCEHFSLFFSPLTAKITIVNDQDLANAGAFGVDKAELNDLGEVIKKGKKSRQEFGGYLKMQMKKDLFENVGLQTKIDIFSNYIDNPQNLDISWEVLISMKVNKFISASISTHLLYDDDVDIAVDTNDDGITDKKGPRTQFKEVLGIGLSYKF